MYHSLIIIVARGLAGVESVLLRSSPWWARLALSTMAVSLSLSLGMVLGAGPHQMPPSLSLAWVIKQTQLHRWALAVTAAG